MVGYPGGVAWEIMMARICQLYVSLHNTLAFLSHALSRASYPNAAPNVLVWRFFTIFSKWKWPMPVLLRPLDESASAQYGLNAKRVRSCDCVNA